MSKKIITQLEFTDLLKKEVLNVQKSRDTTESKIEKDKYFYYQMALLYAIDKLINVYTITN